MFEDTQVDAIIHCKYCQSWPDSYTCSHPDSMRRKPDNGDIIIRECLFGQMFAWNTNWQLHPCVLFEGTIFLEEEGKILAVYKSGSIVQEQKAAKELPIV